MGTWGHRLYDNDTSLDVKDQFEEELHRGKTVEDITQLMINDYECNLTFLMKRFSSGVPLRIPSGTGGCCFPRFSSRRCTGYRNCRRMVSVCRQSSRKCWMTSAQNFCLPSLQFGSHAREDYISANGKSEMCLLSKWKEKKQRSEIFTAGSS